jgi:uncharacterized repeat protein (TIGR01451 family)
MSKRLSLFTFTIFISVFFTGCSTDGIFKRDEVARGQAFSPFRSTTSRLELTPTNDSKLTKKDVLLVATAFDSKGETLGRRNVEWSIEGPGEFVAIDSGGWFTTGGKKTGGKFARTTTHTFQSKLEKKTYSSSAEEPVIQHGQTWVVVSSAVEGQTVITAVCPDIADRDRGRSVAKITWADSEFGFPQKTVVPVGGEHKLRTDLARMANTLGYRVRYRIIGGTAATLLPSTGIGSDTYTSLTGGNSQDLTTNSDADGSAEIKIAQAAPAGGSTRIAVEIIKPDADGVGPGTVVAKNQTVVEWAAPQLSMDFRGPATAGENQETTYTLNVANSGKAESQQVTIRASMTPSLTFISSDPMPSVQQGREQAWVLPAIPAGQSRSIKMQVKPARKGNFELNAVAQTPDGMMAEKRLNGVADSASLKVSFDATPVVPVSELAPVKVLVTNTGAVAIDRATVWLNGGEGVVLGRREPGEPMDVTVGPLLPGKSQVAEVMVRSDRAGKYPIKATVTADGGITEKAESILEAKTMGMKVLLNGPDRIGIGETATYSVILRNTGEYNLSDVIVKSDLPRGINAVKAESGSVSSNGGIATWKINNLAAGETKQFQLTANGDRPGASPSSSTIITTASAGRVGTKSIDARAENSVTVSGSPAVEIELDEPPSAVPVGERTSLRCTIRNRGTGSARDVQITVTAPNELSAIRGRSNLSGDATINESRILFPVIQSLAPGQAVTVYADFEAVRSGSARVRAEATSTDLPNPVREEQALRVSGGR